MPRLTPDKRNEARRLATLIDTLYEARAHLVVLAAGEPEALYPQGDQAFEFERTASRLREMRSAGLARGGGTVGRRGAGSCGALPVPLSP